MKNRKGFTLVELIAVIGILAIIITIAGISIVKVRENIMKTDYDNLVTTIKIAAESYHEETGIDIVPVNILLQSGKLQADSTNYEDVDEGISKGDPVIFNPIDGSPLNCAAVIFENGEVQDFDIEKGCSSEALAAVELMVGYKINGGEGKTLAKTGNNWIGLPSKSDTLTLYVGTSLKSATWISSKAPDKSYDGNTIDVSIPESGKIQETYTVSGKIDGKYVSTDFELKVDANAPLVEKFYVNEGDSWKTSKNIYADIRDNESGIKSYAIVNKESCAEADFQDYNSSSGTTVYKNVNKGGNYTICVKDNAGHVTTKKNAVTVTNIDNAAPIMTITSTAHNWTKNGSFTIKLQDVNSSGTAAGFTNGNNVSLKYKWSTTKITNCSEIPDTNKVTFTLGNNDIYTSTSYSITGQTGNGKIYVCPIDNIKDKAGNTMENKPVSDAMLLDNVAPTCTLSASASAVTLSSKNDANSGIASYGLDKSSGAAYNSSTSTSIAAGTYYGHVKDAAGNTNSCTITIGTTTSSSCNCYDYDVACGTRTESYSCTESYTSTCSRSVPYDCSYSQSYDCSYSESYDCSYTENYSCTKYVSCTKSERYACGTTRKCCYRHGSYICDEYDCGTTTNYCTRTYQSTCPTTATCSRRVSKTCSRRVSRTCSRTVSQTCYRNENYSCTKTRSATCYRDVTKYCTHTSCSTCYNCPSGYSKINNTYCYK